MSPSVEEQAPSGRGGAVTPTNTSPPHPSDIFNTPVQATSSSTQNFTAEPVTGHKEAPKRRKRYADEMRPKLSTVELDKFLADYMPGTDMPEELATKIPALDKQALMGTLENPVCDTVVRKVKRTYTDHYS